MYTIPLIPSIIVAIIVSAAITFITLHGEKGTEEQRKPKGK